MRQRFVSLSVLACLVGACSAPPGEVTVASVSEANLPLPLARTGKGIRPSAVRPAFTPVGLDTRPITAMLRMNEEPMTLVQARTLTRRLTLVERAGLRNALVSRQEPVRNAVESLGATVVHSYQNAYNGLMLRVPRNQLAALAKVPGVMGVYPLQPKRHENTLAVPFVGAPTVWSRWPGGIRGERVKVAVIDTGIDYTHANFGGPGTPEAFEAAHAAEAEAPDPAWFGPSAPRIKGGIDLVGDAYDPDSEDPEIATPHPDDNPLDCNGHGSHVAGTLAGSGVTSGGSTYLGPYDASTLSKAFRIGPGVAPRAELYAVRVFGCGGATLADIDAIEWAVDNDMDVISMSLASPYGRADDPSAEAASNAVKSGVVVVAAASNEGPIPYITGSPATGDGVVSVGAVDARATLPAATLALNEGTITAHNSNSATFADGTSYPVAVLGTTDAIGAGCDPAEYERADLPGALVVLALGGACNAFDSILAAQAVGAAAVATVAPGEDYPFAFGQNPALTIPVFGVTAEDGAALAQSTTATATHLSVENADFRAQAFFSSSGPRFGDSALKPLVSAPGVAVISSASGTGSGAAAGSGTSMATPVTSGLAALTRQAHPTWSAADVATALVNTADPRLVNGYVTSSAGMGVAQGPAAVTTLAVATTGGAPSVNLGFIDLRKDVKEVRDIEIRNLDRSGMTFNVKVASDLTQGVEHSVSTSRQVYVPGQGSATVRATFRLSASTPVEPGAFPEFGGAIELVPADGRSNRGVTLRVPYYGVVRPAARLAGSITEPRRHQPGSVKVTNRKSEIAGTADLYAWGIEGSEGDAGCNDVRAVGVQSFDYEGERALGFAINGWRRCSAASVNEYDIVITAENGDQYLLLGIDSGLIQWGGFSGELGALVVNLTTGESTFGGAVALTDSGMVYLYALASQLGLSADAPRLSYTIAAYDIFGLSPDDVIDEVGTFNAYDSALVGQGQSASVEANAAVRLPLGIQRNEWALTPPKGLMLVLAENSPGSEQAALFALAGPR